MLKPYYQKDKLELGLDEAGRGCLLGPVCVAAVILNPDEDVLPLTPIRDSKKCSQSRREYLREYIESVAISYSVQFVSEKDIDKLNILQATMKGMHLCIDDIRKNLDVDTLLVDGTYFPFYMNDDFEAIDHYCIAGGDDIYQSIAAASILAKTYRDEYIRGLADKNPILHQYGVSSNKGYGTSQHIQGIKEHGITEYHRKSFRPCKDQ